VHSNRIRRHALLIGRISTQGSWVGSGITRFAVILIGREKVTVADGSNEA